MNRSVAIVGAGVSGLTCAVLLAENGYRTVIFADETGSRTTSAVAAAIWYPYDAEPFDAVIAWSLTTFERLRALASEPGTGVSMLELRQFARAGEAAVPEWALTLGARKLRLTETPAAFTSGFALTVPLTDTSIYLNYLAERLVAAGGKIRGNVHFNALGEISSAFGLIVNCSGVGARRLVGDHDVEPHRGQVLLVANPGLQHAVVCDDPPLMYAIPRAHDCVFGGTNEISDSREPDAASSARILTECSRVLGIEPPRVLRERVGLRPFRKSGVCLNHERLSDGRAVIHNYGHGGSGFTLSWGCAEEVLALAQQVQN